MTTSATTATHGKAGVFWSTLNGAATVVLPFAVFAAFARLLTPAAFAQMGLAVAALEFLKTLAPMGFYDVLVTHEESDFAAQQTAAFVFLAGAFGVMAIYALVILGASMLFGMAITPLALLMAGKALFDLALLQPQAVLVRRGEVRRLGARGLIAASLAGALGLAIGLLISPLLGLALYYLLGAAITWAMTVIGTRALARPRLHLAKFAEMRRQAVWASGVRFSAAANSYLDQLVAGLRLAPAAVGFYNLGKRIEVMSMTLAGSLSQILWQPAFARKSADPEREFARALAAAALVCGVPSLALAVTAPMAVPLLFGRQWAPAAPLVAMLALSGLARALGSVAGAAMTATRRNGLLLTLSLAAAAMNLAIIALASPLGLERTGALLATRNLVHALVMIALLRELRGSAATIVLRNFVVPLALALAFMGLLLRLTADLPHGVAQDLWRVALVCAGGGATGLILLWRKL